MKMKLIVSLLALCLTLSIVSVQAQTDKDMTGNMEDMSAILAGNIDETITCNMTGNAAMVGMDNISGKMENMTKMGNMTRPMTFNMVGKVVIVKDVGNMTEKALIIGKMENMPGKVVIFGKMDKMGVMDARMENMSGISETLQNMTIVKVGTMTGTVKCNMTTDMENMTGMATKMENMTGRMENMKVLAAGDMTGTITCDLTGKMIIIRNMGSMEEVAGKIFSIPGMAEKMDNITGKMENITRPMTCNMTGGMIICKDMDNMTSMVEKMDTMPGMAEKMDYLRGMDASTVVLEDMDMTGMAGEMGNMTRMHGKMGVTGKKIMIRNMDGMTQIITRTVTCNITGNTTTIKNMRT